MKKLFLQGISLILPLIFAGGSASGMLRQACRFTSLARRAAVQRTVRRPEIKPSIGQMQRSTRLSNASQLSTLSASSRLLGGSSYNFAGSSATRLGSNNNDWNWNNNDKEFHDSKTGYVAASFGFLVPSWIKDWWNGPELTIENVNYSGTLKQLLKQADSDESLKKELIQFVAENITQMDRWALGEIIKHYPEAAEIVVKAAIEKIEVGEEASILIEIIRRCSHKYKDYKRDRGYDFSELEDYSAFDSWVPKHESLGSVESEVEDAAVYIEKELRKGLLGKRLRDYFYKKTATQSHIEHLGLVNILANEGRLYYKDQNLRRLFRSCHTLEKEHQQKYYTFVHGQRWEYEFVEQLYTDLWACSEDRKRPDDFVFAHVKPMNAMHGSQMRKEILKSGQFDSSGAVSRDVLFLNKAFFGNTYKSGCCTARIVRINKNCGSISVSPDQVFAMHGYQKIYQKYKNEIQDLEELHTQASEYGNLLFIAVPKKLINKSVYICYFGGKSSAIVDGKETDDIAQICDVLQEDLSRIEDPDRKEFCLIMTSDMGLNPDSGIKVIPVNAADQAKYALYKQKYEALMSNIKKDLGVK